MDVSGDTKQMQIGRRVFDRWTCAVVECSEGGNLGMTTDPEQCQLMDRVYSLLSKTLLHAEELEQSAPGVDSKSPVAKQPLTRAIDMPLGTPPRAAPQNHSKHLSGPGKLTNSP